MCSNRGFTRCRRRVVWKVTAEIARAAGIERGLIVIGEMKRVLGKYLMGSTLDAWWEDESWKTLSTHRQSFHTAHDDGWKVLEKLEKVWTSLKVENWYFSPLGSVKVVEVVREGVGGSNSTIEALLTKLRLFIFLFFLSLSVCPLMVLKWEFAERRRWLGCEMWWLWITSVNEHDGSWEPKWTASYLIRPVLVEWTIGKLTGSSSSIHSYAQLQSSTATKHPLVDWVTCSSAALTFLLKIFKSASTSLQLSSRSRNRRLDRMPSESGRSRQV